ncbi:MAG: DUF3883 domain-containing protein [Oscillospiraceae bacterium]|jgi:superfamily II DNA or RNA helicase|nr:DUF3883 domain-containing protein [Oscillospiraceae bacterium]
MALLEDLRVGAGVTGITGSVPVRVVAVKWHGTGCLTLTYKESDGRVAEEILYRDDEERIGIADTGLPWSFDADAAHMRLVSEAYRIHLAHLFDPYIAIHTSAIEPLPHQITAVYQEMLPRLPMRYILADDPGAGKTVMTGLFLKELYLRGDLKRCMIVCPGSLAEQWQEELYSKFDLRFTILSNDAFHNAVTGNAFAETGFCIVRLDKLARDEDLQKKACALDWDVIVCDEAHKMSATVWGGEVKYTKRYQLGKQLGAHTRHFLLLTATPHNGKEEDFRLFLSLIDPDRFEGAKHNTEQTADVSDVMRRLVKEDLLKFDGTPLFPERLAYTVNYDLSPKEAALYAAVTDYVQEEFNRADKLDKERKNTVGFALTVLQRRLASSPEAIYQSLKRRRERLESRLTEERTGKRTESYVFWSDEDYDEDDLSANEMEAAEEEVADRASAAKTIAEMEAEIASLKRLERMADAVRRSGEDRKWDELSKLLQDDGNMFGPDGEREKLIIFTEQRDTLRYLAAKIGSLLGSAEAVACIHGGMNREERHNVEAAFKQNPDVRILVATDAAGEGINLQRAHLMVNYDLPWNPNRLEQRFGRIHRIGQTEVCHLWNLVAQETREGLVFQRLFEKLNQEREALQGKVFDVLGKLTFNNQSLRELLIEAVRYGNDPAVRARLTQAVDNSLDTEALRRLLAEHALTDDTMDTTLVNAVREDMERMEAHRLQPHFIADFFLGALKELGGSVREREKDRYEVTHVPAAVRSRDIQIGFGKPVLKAYERICFEKALIQPDGKKLADLIAPGHPLLEAVGGLVRERFGDTLKRGAIFVDRRSDNPEPRILFYIEDTVQDGVLLPNGNKRVISRHLHFAELYADGRAANAGYAPYLDYDPPTEEEYAAAQSYIRQEPWLCEGVEERAVSYAVEQLIPAHIGEVKQRRLARIEKTAAAVRARLTAEIQYWDFRAGELAEKEAMGKPNAKLNADNARKRADDLQARMQKRLADLEAEKRISPQPPVVVGGAVVLPEALLHSLLPAAGSAPATFAADAASRRTIERAAMKAVMDIETSLGYTPTDVSAEKRGYDIESKVPAHLRGADGHSLRFIEVKGRAKGADTVTVSKNEILTAFNKPDEYILAIVEVSGTATKTIYLKKPFRERPDFAATSVNYNIVELVNGSEILLARGDQ